MLARFFLCLALLFASPSLAAERVPSTTATGTGLNLGTGFTVDGNGDLVGTGVYGARADYPTTGIVAGHTYKYSISLTRTAGTAHIYVTGVKHGNSGAYVTSPNTPSVGGVGGFNSIASNFTVANAFGTTAIEAREPDHNGSFRFLCKPGQVLPDDPLLLPGYPGAAHLHQFWGNTGANAKSTYRSLRTTGGTTCGISKYPVWRTGYWTPAMLNGMGGVVKPVSILNYYKGLPSSLPECQAAPDATHIGICVNFPNGIRFIFGYDHSKPNELASIAGGSTPNQNAMYYGFDFQCTTAPGAGSLHPTANGNYHSIDETVAAGCPAGAYLKVGTIAPMCWDGVNLDSPDHRAHMSYAGALATGGPAGGLTLAANALLVDGTGTALPPGTWERCPTTHPYVLPTYSAIISYPTDANFAAGKWHLSSDEQRAGATPAGQTLHQDYWDAQDPYVKSQWYAGCINRKHSCNSGAMGNAAYPGTGEIVLGMGGTGGLKSPLAIRSRVGWSRPLSASGTFTGEFKAVSGGELGIYAYGGFTGTITSWSITDVTPASTIVPVTQPHTH